MPLIVFTLRFLTNLPYLLEKGGRMRTLITLFMFLPLMAFGQTNPNIQAELSKLAWQNGPRRVSS